MPSGRRHSDALGGWPAFGDSTFERVGAVAVIPPAEGGR
jgi:hypothetical protein